MKYLIVGLGNVGNEYAETRHNIGFMILDAMALEANVRFTTERYASKTVCKYKGRQFVLIKPSTYMNLSGKAVRYWMEKENILIENILIITDDIALPLGTLRMKAKGSDGGHNGLNHIIELLNTEDFARLRFGIGNDFPKGHQVDYVLEKWNNEEKKIIQERIKFAIEMIHTFGTAGMGKAMNAYNNK